MIAKKTVAGDQLIWLVTQAFRNETAIPRYLAFSILPADGSGGWRVIVGKKSRRFLTPRAYGRLAAVERGLGARFALAK